MKEALHAILFFILSGLTHSIPILKQIQVIVRSGESESPLSKVDPGLTKEGFTNLKDLGSWLQERYGRWIGQSYDSPRMRFESSDYDRAILSAHAIGQGLFRNSSLPHVPVHSFDATEDVFLTSHEKCPAFWDAQWKLYQSDTWKELEATNAKKLALLGDLQLFDRYRSRETGKVVLSSVYDIFTELNVACGQSDENEFENCLQDNFEFILNSDSWKELKELASLTKLLEFSTGHMLGGPLLAKMAERFHTPRKLYVYSAHYETILATLVGLGLKPSFVPDYGDALILELFEETKDPSKDWIKVSWARDLREEEVVEFADACSNAGCPKNYKGKNVLPLEYFHNQIRRQANFTTHREWCRQCQNVKSYFCRAVLTEDENERQEMLSNGNLRATEPPTTMSNNPMENMSPQIPASTTPTSSTNATESDLVAMGIVQPMVESDQPTQKQKQETVQGAADVVVTNCPVTHAHIFGALLCGMIVGALAVVCFVPVCTQMFRRRGVSRQKQQDDIVSKALRDHDNVIDFAPSVTITNEKTFSSDLGTYTIS